MSLKITEDHLDAIKAILKNYDYKFYVFGSRSTGKSSKLSDLDLYSKDDIPLEKLSEIKEDFEESDLPFKVDIILSKYINKEFKNRISKDLQEIA